MALHSDFRVSSPSLVLVGRGQSLSLADSRGARSESVHVDGARVGASIDVLRASRRGFTARCHCKAHLCIVYFSEVSPKKYLRIESLICSNSSSTSVNSQRQAQTSRQQSQAKCMYQTEHKVCRTIQVQAQNHHEARTSHWHAHSRHTSCTQLQVDPGHSKRLHTTRASTRSKSAHSTHAQTPRRGVERDN
jgi:hypothetical protein